MQVEYIQEVCKHHTDCKDCPMSEINNGKPVCVFNGTPDTWDLYGHNKKEEK